jgi:hypothetical protein
LTPQHRKRHQEEELCVKCHKKGHGPFHCPELKGKVAVGASSKRKSWWQGCSSDELKQLATSSGRPETMLATEVVESHSTPSSTTIATPAKLVARRRRPNKERENRKHVTIRSIDWKLVDRVVEPLHAQFDLTVEGFADGKGGLNSHGDLPHCSPIDSILESDLSGERVLINPPWELT